MFNAVQEIRLTLVNACRGFVKWCAGQGGCLQIVVVFLSNILFVGCEKTGPIPPDNIDKDGLIQSPASPASCVVLYYKAVINGNHAQYQYCVKEPMSIQCFKQRTEELKEEMEKTGRKPHVRPAKTQSPAIIEKTTGNATVQAFSPWSGKETTFYVRRFGQGWQITNEEVWP